MKCWKTLFIPAHTGKAYWRPQNVGTEYESTIRRFE